jgi:hypothetical protein
LVTIIGTTGKAGDVDEFKLNQPQGMCLDKMGRLLIANYGGNNIVRYDPMQPSTGKQTLSLISFASHFRFHDVSLVDHFIFPFSLPHTLFQVR